MASFAPRDRGSAPYNYIRRSLVGHVVRRRWVALTFGLLAVAVLGVRGPEPVGAEEPTGLQFAASMEDAMIEAIARAEKSVVAIARVSEAQAAELSASPRLEIFGPFPSQLPADEATNATNPSFVPNEFATGVIVDRAGFVVTNYHVLRERSEYWVRTIDHKTYEAKVRAADERSDLAVLQITAPGEGTEFTPITFGDASKLRKGQIVISLGNPYAIARDGEASASWGIVSNLSRKVAANSRESVTLHQFGTLIQTDAKLNLGTSGGALLNLKGEMVGLTTALAATSGYEQAAGYAIPIDATFLRILQTLKAGREVEYGFLGVQPENLAGFEIREGKQGVRISLVSMGTPAEKDEVRVRDIVTHINGVPIHDADGLRLQVGKLAPHEIVSLSIDRGGQSLTRQVILSKLPRIVDKGQRIATVRDPAWRGIRVDYVHAIIPDALWPRMAGQGVAVSEVEENSPAYKVGLRDGELITHVGGTPVITPEEFSREVADSVGPVTLMVLSGDDVRARAIEIPAP